MKKTVKGVICAVMVLITVILSACSGTKPETASFEAMDTLMSLTVYGGEMCSQLKSEINKLDSLLDATDDGSEIYRLNRDKSAGLSADTDRLIGEALALCGRLDGYFDITVYPAVLEWGFTTGRYNIPDKDTLKKLAEDIGFSRVERVEGHVTLPDDTMIDLGAIAKGYAAGRCLEILKGSKATAAVLNLGGTIALYGEKPDKSPFKVGIADPENPAGYFGYLSCGEGVISTSGGYERYFERDGKRYIHILDPKTAEPVDNGIASVTVISDDGPAADALSTALFVMGLDKALRFYENGFKSDGRDFIILTDSGDVYVTDGIYDGFTLAEGYDYKVIKV